jgi:hypothetical protein
MNRKLATILAGTAALGTLAFAPIAGAQSDPATVVVIEPAAPAETVVVAPAETVVVPEPTAPLDSPRNFNSVPAERIGRVPSPYPDMPGSGHVGDEFYYKQAGGTAPG